MKIRKYRICFQIFKYSKTPIQQFHLSNKLFRGKKNKRHIIVKLIGSLLHSKSKTKMVDRMVWRWKTELIRVYEYFEYKQVCKRVKFSDSYWILNNKQKYFLKKSNNKTCLN